MGASTYQKATIIGGNTPRGRHCKPTAHRPHHRKLPNLSSRNTHYSPPLTPLIPQPHPPCRSTFGHLHHSHICNPSAPYFLPIHCRQLQARGAGCSHIQSINRIETVPVHPQPLFQPSLLLGNLIQLQHYLQTSQVNPRLVEMADITTDESPPNELGKPPAPARLPITNVSQWVEHFSLKAAVICTRFPHKALELLAYQAATA